MEHSIGVGAIVGLTFASSIYVWNNHRFSSTQKTLLLICIIFPPAQWLGILIVSIYNSNVENNTPERKTEKKLDSSISNLTELKDKGILTEEEYKTKVDKIEVEKIEQNLKNSLEYRQLKSLFDGGILTKEEFENKIQLLQSVSEKEVETREIAKIINSVNKTYIDSTEEKVEVKKESSTPIYIRSILFFAILIVGIMIFSNTSPNNTEEVYSQPTIDTTAVDNTSYQEPLKVKKFVYVIFKVSSPELEDYKMVRDSTNTLGFLTSKNGYKLSWKDKILMSKILEIDNYKEDKKHIYIDKAQKNIIIELKRYDSIFAVTLFKKTKDDSALKTTNNNRYKSEVTDRQIFTFDSYSEASISKEKNIK